jgi:hypothetical protein
MGEVAMDEPPGFTERFYRQWKDEGGQVIHPKPPSDRDVFLAGLRSNYRASAVVLAAAVTNLVAAGILAYTVWSR